MFHFISIHIHEHDACYGGQKTHCTLLSMKEDGSDHDHGNIGKNRISELETSMIEEVVADVTRNKDLTVAFSSTSPNSADERRSTAASRTREGLPVLSTRVCGSTWPHS
jgi:hypothetical protein